MKKILIISTSTDEEKKLEEVAVHHPKERLQITTIGSFSQDPGWWIDNAPNALIVQMPEDLLIQGYFVEKLRIVIPKSVPLLILCPLISADLLNLSSQFQKLRTIKTPVNPFFLFRAVIDLVTDYGPGKNQAHPRFVTDLAVTIKSTEKSFSVAGKMKNISLGGAYLESENIHQKFKAGDVVRMTVSVNGKSYEFDSRIVWARELLERNMGYGLTFVTTDQVFDHLFSEL